MITASDDRTARLFDSKSGRPLKVFQGHTSSVHHAAFSPDGKTVITASADNVARLWSTSLPSRKQLITRTGKLTNYRVCKETLEVVAVLPFPKPETVWAEETDPALCQETAQ